MFYRIIISVDGIFEQWSDWSECSQSCGNGVMFRNRTCYGPYYGGKPCDGAENQTEACNIGECLGKDTLSF